MNPSLLRLLLQKRPQNFLRKLTHRPHLRAHGQQAGIRARLALVAIVLGVEVELKVTGSNQDQIQLGDAHEEDAPSHPTLGIPSSPPA